MLVIRSPAFSASRRKRRSDSASAATMSWCSVTSTKVESTPVMTSPSHSARALTQNQRSSPSLHVQADELVDDVLPGRERDARGRLAAAGTAMPSAWTPPRSLTDVAPIELRARAPQDALGGLVDVHDHAVRVAYDHALVHAVHDVAEAGLGGGPAVGLARGSLAADSHASYRPFARPALPLSLPAAAAG